MHLIAPTMLVHNWTVHLSLGVADCLISETIGNLFVAELRTFGAPNGGFLAYHSRRLAPCRVYLLAWQH